jgi:tetratricopeptide (TPR) repeat protein
MPVSHLNLKAIIDGHAAALLEEGRVEEALATGQDAVKTAREALAIDETHRALLVQALENLAEINRTADRHTDAEPLYREALDEALKAKLDLSVAAQIRTSLATLLDGMGREADSIPFYEQAIKDLEALEPPDLQTAGQLRNNLALNYKRMDKLALAEQHYLRALEALEGSEGAESEMVASICNNLGGLYYAAGFADQAKDMFEDAITVRLKLLGPNHPDVAQSHSNMATVQHELGDNEAAQRSYEQALRILEAHIPAEAESYEAVGNDYIALLGSIQEDRKATAFQKRMEKVLAQIGAAE